MQKSDNEKLGVDTPQQALSIHPPRRDNPVTAPPRPASPVPPTYF